MLRRHRKAFLLGCIEPDFNIFSYLRGMRRYKKFHGHNAENSFMFLMHCADVFDENAPRSAWDYFRLGTAIHYIADAFTASHNGFWTGSLLEHSAMSLDWGILQWIQSTLVCPALDFLMPKITALGNAGAIWLLAAVVLIITKKYRRQGLFLLLGLAASVLVGNVLLKNLVARPRPCRIDTSVPLLIANPTDYSFPSGHTLLSAISATIMAKTDRRFGYAAIPPAVLIAFSRLYLFVHFPSDVLAAAVLGLVIGKLIFRFGGAALDRIKRCGLV